MKVRCFLCAHEKDGFCQKKKTSSKPTKIRLNKPRSCELYSEDPLRVLADYRKKELHKKKVQMIQNRNNQLAEAISKMQADLASRKASQEPNNDL